MALNAKIENDDGSEHRTKNADGSERWSWEAMMTLNAEIEKRWWLWTPKSRMMMALNVKTENDDGSECRNWEWWWLWMSKLRRDSGSECQDWEWWWLWMSKLRIDDGFECRNREVMVSSNAQNENTDLNAKLKMRLWTPIWICGSKHQSKNRHDDSKCWIENARR